ncbi:acyl-CoA thioesterase [Castellaniella sp.]|uniref:acyl-CoA thioesterase n=1 Tax=Castellaniella sp. TaxID=1955812 RepID=UPI00355F7477
MSRPQPRSRSAYRAFLPIQTRWMDNDVYGHVNNVTYYSYFDTAVNHYLLEQGVLDFNTGATIGLVVETGCQYFSSVSFPDALEAGIAVSRIGTSSVRYEVGILLQGAELTCAAGHFVHVYVDRASRRPAPLADTFRAVLAPLVCDPNAFPSG